MLWTKGWSFRNFKKQGSLPAGKDVSQKVLNLQSGFAAAFENPLPNFVLQDLLVWLGGAALFALALHMKKLNARKFRKDEEYGSVRWGNG